MTLRRRDLLWLLAYPLYQLIGTFRHEASHALAAWMEKAEIREFVIWPKLWGEPRYWGYVRWEGGTSWVTLAAPYLCDLLCFVITAAILGSMSFRRKWVWINLFILGMGSPLVNSAYNYSGTFLRSLGILRPKATSTPFVSDVTRLLNTLPPEVVHVYFITTILAYGVISGLVLRRAVRHSISDSPE